MSRASTTIIGLGSSYGDDQVGIVVTQRLQTVFPTLKVCVARSPGELLDMLDHCDELHIIDACRGAGPPGTIVREQWPAACMAAPQFQGTHDLTLDAALHLAEKFGCLPKRVVLWGIETATLTDQATFLAPLSSIAATAAERLIERIAAELPTMEVQHA